MKKIASLLFIFVLILCLGSCGHEHQWEKATCTAPKTCTSCGETEGDILTHTYSTATCVAPKTCTLCGSTEGSSLGHLYAAATCVLPKTCLVCNAIDGEALGHSYKNGVCEVCSEIDPKAKPEQLAICEEIIEKLETLESACNAQSSAYKQAWYFTIYEAEDYYIFDEIVAAFSRRIAMDSENIIKGAVEYLEGIGMETTLLNVMAAIRTTSGALAITQSAMNLRFDMDNMCEKLVEEIMSDLEKINANVIGKEYGEAILDYCNVLLNYYEFAKSPSGSYNSYTTNANDFRNLCTNAKNAIKIAKL